MDASTYLLKLLLQDILLMSVKKMFISYCVAGGLNIKEK